MSSLICWSEGLVLCPGAVTSAYLQYCGESIAHCHHTTICRYLGHLRLVNPEIIDILHGCFRYVEHTVTTSHHAFSELLGKLDWTGALAGWPWGTTRGR